MYINNSTLVNQLLPQSSVPAKNTATSHSEKSNHKSSIIGFPSVTMPQNSGSHLHRKDSVLKHTEQLHL